MVKPFTNTQKIVFRLALQDDISEFIYERYPGDSLYEVNMRKYLLSLKLVEVNNETN